jgi:hypothetical protein
MFVINPPFGLEEAARDVALVFKKGGDTGQVPRVAPRDP